MRKPILLVAGFARSGTTMMMTMLDRGGFPVAGPRPAYEVDQMGPRNTGSATWVRQQSGKAVKWIDPLSTTIRADILGAPAVIIRMVRPVNESAASQAKFMSFMIGLPNTRQLRRTLEADLRKEEPHMEHILEKCGPVYHFSFEWVLLHRREAANKLDAITREHFGITLDTDKVASVPIHRPPGCAPDLAIEMSMSQIKKENR